MSETIRYVPPEGALVEVITRTVQGRYLLRPSQQLEDLTIGILACAYAEYPVPVCTSLGPLLQPLSQNWERGAEQLPIRTSASPSPEFGRGGSRGRGSTCGVLQGGSEGALDGLGLFFGEYRNAADEL